jgi:hypothetical protein
MTETATQPLIPVLKRRIRALTYLAGATGLAVLLAALSMMLRTSAGESDFKPTRMFAELASRLDDVATIQIEAKDVSFNVVRDAQGLWTLPDKAKYPADFNTVRKTILGLAELDLVAEKTSRADWQEKLGLGLPKTGGTGTLVTLKDAKGDVMAALVAGASAEGEAAGGRQAIYVRRPDEPQTFVARGHFSPTTDQAQWLDKTFVDFARDRIKTVAMKPFKGRPYTVTRDKPDDANFRVVEAIPAGRQFRTESEPNSIGNALLGISFDDVKPISLVDFAKAATLEVTTFDGLTASFKIVEKDRDFWIALEATANPSASAAPAKPGALKPDVAKEAKEINALAGGWAYKVPRYKGAVMTAPLEDLLRPIGGG